MNRPSWSAWCLRTAGWIDILTGITAHKRQDGESLVFVEEDCQAKVLLYGWKR